MKTFSRVYYVLAIIGVAALCLAWLVDYLRSGSLSDDWPLFLYGLGVLLSAVLFGLGGVARKVSLALGLLLVVVLVVWFYLFSLSGMAT